MSPHVLREGSPLSACPSNQTGTSTHYINQRTIPTDPTSHSQPSITMVWIHLFQILSLLAVAQAGVVRRANGTTPVKSESPASGLLASNEAEVIIIGGGIAGIAVARTLIQEYNITNIILIEGRDELGGRAHTETLTGKDGKSWTVEKGCNWIQGPGKEPIEELALKWNLTSTPTDYGDVIFFEGKAGVEGEEESGMRGSFLTEEESLVFTEGYDNFLENAAGYSGEYRF